MSKNYIMQTSNKDSQLVIETCPICGHDLLDVFLTCYPPIHKKECYNCGWSWTEDKRNYRVVRVPFNLES